MNKTFEELNAEELNMISGGNYGDADKDKDPNHSRYQVGQEVEVYFTNVHASTRRCRIIEAGYDRITNIWYYTFKKVDGSSWGLLSTTDDGCLCATADRIES